MRYLLMIRYGGKETELPYVLDKYRVILKSEKKRSCATPVTKLGERERERSGEKKRKHLFLYTESVYTLSSYRCSNFRNSKQ